MKGRRDTRSWLTRLAAWRARRRVERFRAGKSEEVAAQEREARAALARAEDDAIVDMLVEDLKRARRG